MQILISLLCLISIMIGFYIVGQKLNNILWLLTESSEEGKKEMATLMELQAQVAENTGLEASAIQLIEGLAGQILDNKNDPEKIEDITNALKASAAALAAAIMANTPQTIEPIPAV